MHHRAVRVALVGYGRAGRTIHTPLIRSTSELDLAVVASSRGDAVRADLPDATIVAEPSQAWRRDDVDLVVIATPNDTHAPLAAGALEAGKHVVVDKPFAVSVDEAKSLAEIAARTGRLLTVFHNRRWDGDFLGLRAIVGAETLGEISHFESHFDRFRPNVTDRWRDWRGPGSGVWADLGPHLVDQALQLFGRPAWVFGELSAHRPGAQTVDYAHVVLGYARRLVVLHCSTLVAANRPRFIVHGQRASWLTYGLDPQEFELARAVGVDLGAPPVQSAVTVDGATGAEAPSALPRGDYGRFYQQVAAAIRGEGPTPVSLADAIAVTEVIEAAARSSRQPVFTEPPASPSRTAST
jgi:predicted dehydrogenase